MLSLSNISWYLFNLKKNQSKINKKFKGLMKFIIHPSFDKKRKEKETHHTNVFFFFFFGGHIILTLLFFLLIYHINIFLFALKKKIPYFLTH